MSNHESLAKYRSLCDTEASIPFFLRAGWMDSVCGSSNWDAIIVEKNGEIVGAMPYFTKKRCGISYITQPPLTPSNGPWIRPIVLRMEKKIQYENEIMSKLIVDIEKRNILFYVQNCTHDIINWIPYYQHGYTQTTRYSYRIKLTEDICEVRNHLSSSLRNEIKRAEEQANIFESWDVGMFYETWDKTFRRQNMPVPTSIETIDKILRYCQNAQCGKAYFAKDANSNIHCCALFVYDSKSVYYLLSGTDPIYRKSNFLSALIMKGIELASTLHLEFDFEGSMVQGIEAYFRKFGGELTPYFRIAKVYKKIPIADKLLLLKLL